MPVRLLVQTTPRPQVVEIAGHRALPPLSRGIGWPARGSGCGALAAKHREGEVSDKGSEETDGMLGSNGGSEPRREQERFVAVRAVDKTHKSTQLPKSHKGSRASAPCYSLPKHRVLTQSGAMFGGVARLPSRMSGHGIRLDHCEFFRLRLLRMIQIPAQL